MVSQSPFVLDWTLIMSCLDPGVGMPPPLPFSRELASTAIVSEATGQSNNKVYWSKDLYRYRAEEMIDGWEGPGVPTTLNRGSIYNNRRTDHPCATQDTRPSNIDKNNQHSRRQIDPFDCIYPALSTDSSTLRVD